MMRRRVLLAGLPLLCFLGFAWSAGTMLRKEAVDGYRPSTLPSALIGQSHPTVNLPLLTGLGRPGLTEEGFRNGVTVVNVFSSWCVPCRQEHRALMSLAQHPRIKLLGINYKDDPEDALKFLAQHGNPFDAVGVDETGRNAIDWGVYGVPETFVVDTKRRIVLKHVGPLDDRALHDELGPAIEAALAD
jgi:cytochrome c biogenesis protein CcmG/thiol:disulfide interchange protein DsbE